VTPRTRIPHRTCDWCQGELGQDVYTLWLTELIQALVGTCCARLAAQVQIQSASPKIAERAHEVLVMLERQK
jgi:hypothetical protein